MNRLILHHRYVGGMTYDSSRNRNHGVPIGVTAGNGPLVDTFEFGRAESQIRVVPSPTFAAPRAMRAMVRFQLRPPAPQPGRRYNLIEGSMSFALMTNDDGSLEGTVFDATDEWNGPRSAPGLVQPGQWHTAELNHDGVERVRLVLDGVVVGEQFGVPGPVRGPDQEGIVIGHWPPRDGHQYTLRGAVGEVRVYVYDPIEEAESLVDRCCADRGALDELASRLERDGWDAARVRRALSAAEEPLRQLVAAAGGGTADGTAAYVAHRRMAALGLLTKNRYALRAAQRWFAAVVGAQAGTAEVVNRLAAAVEGLSLSRAEAASLARLLCLDVLVPPDVDPGGDDPGGPDAPADAAGPDEGGGGDPGDEATFAAPPLEGAGADG